MLTICNLNASNNLVQKNSGTIPTALLSGVSGLLKVDYTNVASIVLELRKHDIDTVISTINLYWLGAP
jgi:hypothetical protein